MNLRSVGGMRFTLFECHGTKITQCARQVHYAHEGAQKLGRNIAGRGSLPFKKRTHFFKRLPPRLRRRGITPPRKEVGYYPPRLAT